MGKLNNFLKTFQLGETYDPLISYTNNQGNMNQTLSKSERAQDSKAIIEDPLSLVQNLGFKDKPFSLSYDVLHKMSMRNSVVSSILLTRINQVSSFTQPARFTRDGVGYQITLRDPKVQPTPIQQRMILALESFLENCGFAYNPNRDSFDTFIRKVIRDSLVYDQLCFEIVPDRLGRPSSFYAVDAATIRAASKEPTEGEDFITNTDMFDGDGKETKWVQVIQGRVESEFNGYELAFAVRNPVTDIDLQPYGTSELEILIHQITAHLWAEEYNSKYFSQGGTTKGILNLKGQNIKREQLEAFRRQWTAQVAGLTGAWKTPVVSVDGLEYINVSQSNREMEYEMWMNYLINICCAVYQIDPAEINFPNRGGAGGSSGGGLGDGGIEDRLKNSKDKGLRPILRFLESVINRFIIKRFTPEFSFNFVGLDPDIETKKLDAMGKEVKTYKTLNEVRKEQDLDPVDNGDIVLDPTYTNYLLQKLQSEQMMQAQGMGGSAGGAEQGSSEQAQDNGEVDWEDQKQQDEDNQIGQSIDTNYSS